MLQHCHRPFFSFFLLPQSCFPDCWFAPSCFVVNRDSLYRVKQIHCTGNTNIRRVFCYCSEAFLHTKQIPQKTHQPKLKMSARAMMLASMLAMGLADTDGDGGADGGNGGDGGADGGRESGNDRYGGGANENRYGGGRQDGYALHSRLLINTASSAVDMYAISRELERFAVQNDTVTLQIYPLFVCPSGACPSGVCPKNLALLTGLGCVINTQAPSRAVPAPAAPAAGTCVLDFVVQSADPKFGGVAIQRIETAVTQNLLANHRVTGYRRIMEAGDVEGGNENRDGGRGDQDGGRGDHHGVSGDHDGDYHEGGHGAGYNNGGGGGNSENTVLIVVCSVSAVVIAISVVVALIYCCCCRKTEKGSNNDDADIESQTTYAARAEAKNMEVMKTLPPAADDCCDPL